MRDGLMYSTQTQTMRPRDRRHLRRHYHQTCEPIN